MIAAQWIGERPGGAVTPSAYRPPGLARLPRRWGTGATSVAPNALYYARQAAAGGFPGVSETLVLAGGGVDPTFDVPEELEGPLDGGVTFVDVRAFQGSAALGDVGADDFVVAIAGIMGAGDFIMNKESVAAIVGWAVFRSAANALLLRTFNGGGTTILTASAAIPVGNPFFASCYVNKSEASAFGSRWAINGQTSGAGVDQSTNGNLNNAGNFTLGMRSNTTVPYLGTLWYWGVWSGPNIFSAGAAGEAEHLAQHRQFFRVLTAGVEKFGII